MHFLAKTAAFSIILEALIGAALVLFELVSHNQSLKRTVSVSLHFVNTLILLGTLTLIAAAIRRIGKPWKIVAPKYKKEIIGITCLFILLGMTGAITALGDTLFPASSLVDGINQDLNQSSHFLIKLRVIHPILAFTLGLLATPWIASILKETKSNAKKTIGRILIISIVVNITLGILTIIWLAPVWLQMIHLSVALLVWVNWVNWIHLLTTEE